MYKDLTQFVKQIKEDLEIMRIKDDDCLDRASFRKEIYDVRTFENINKLRAELWKQKGMIKEYENEVKEWKSTGPTQKVTKHETKQWYLNGP